MSLSRLSTVDWGRPLAARARQGRARAWLVGLKQDLVRSTALVLLLGLSSGVASRGELGPVPVSWIILLAACAGAALGELWQLGFASRHVRPGELLQDAVVTALIAASASSVPLFQVPAGFLAVLRLSGGAAAATVLAYHGTNAILLASGRRHLGLTGGAIFLVAPYALGSLLLLGSVPLPGAALLLFGFNEAVAAAVGLACRRPLPRARRAHLVLLLGAAGAALAPWVAAAGSGGWAASLGPLPRMLVSVISTLGSQAGLWAEVYLITGLIMDGIHRRSPSAESIVMHARQGLGRGVVWGGVFAALLHGVELVGRASVASGLLTSQPMLLGAVLGALVFPVARTILETFDGSSAFLPRLRSSYRRATLFARGAVVGCGVGWGLVQALPHRPGLERAWWGAALGALAFAGVSLLRDVKLALRRRGRVQSWRLYLLEGVLGALIGAGLGSYLDAAQLGVVTEKLHRYVTLGAATAPYEVYPLLSKWGHLQLGRVSGGASLIFAEALAGLICWAVPACLFAVNARVLAALLGRDLAPLRSLFRREGAIALGQNTLEVLRWGLWMSPIIASLLRPTGVPTSYNQDGAIRTLAAVVHSATHSPEAFRAWSLQVFVYLLAFDSVRILIWLDHMALRVATLVNLSFLGLDRLERRLARFVGASATARCIPESVKRFATWAPLLIPFYLPRGADWDHAWTRSESLAQAASSTGALAVLGGLGPLGKLLALGAAMVVALAVFSALRALRPPAAGKLSLSSSAGKLGLSSSVYEVTLAPDGSVFSRRPDRGHDVSRRSYDLLDPAGRALFLVETVPESSVWPIIGGCQSDAAPPLSVEERRGSLAVYRSSRGLDVTVEITLAGEAPAELWTITVENREKRERRVKLAPYLEWVLDQPAADRAHPQYHRLFAELEYVERLHAVLAHDRHSRATGLLAAEAEPEGFLVSRVEFIGRAGSLRTPRGLEKRVFRPARDTAPQPTFDPIGSLLLDVSLPPGGRRRARLLIGETGDRDEALELIARCLSLPGGCNPRRPPSRMPLGHGEAPAGAPQVYGELSEDGRVLRVGTPFTPRPYDHTLANAGGHAVVVTNRGLHTSSSWNSQQNRLTPDWADLVTREVPGEAIYLYDPDRDEWCSPTYHPLGDASAHHDVELRLDGSAVFHMRGGGLATELTVYVPPDDPVGVYLLTVENQGDSPRKLRVAPFFQIVLGEQPERTGPLRVRQIPEQHAVLFENPQNEFRTGTALAAVSCQPELVETRRGRFFGERGDVRHPWLVRQGASAPAGSDDRPIAAFLSTLELAPHGSRTMVVVLGQAADERRALEAARRYLDPGAARAGLERTRSFWRRELGTVEVRTSDPALDRLLDALKYQTITERLWARRGFYQASGAFGFRDQLQDAANLVWVDPRLARRQILLHAAQQFLEGDVPHWFHLLEDGRTGLLSRGHASDLPLWLPWAVAEYVSATGDQSLLEEETFFLEAESPLPPLPDGRHGMTLVPRRSSRAASVYQHAMLAVDHALDRLGARGLPLMGTGDWNDGLDEIGSEGRGESVWLGFFLHYVLRAMAPIIAAREPLKSPEYTEHAESLARALELAWRGDRYLRAIHDDGTEIGVAGSGVWEVDALTAAWSVMAKVNLERGRIAFDTALRSLERDQVILLGWPPLREDTVPRLGRSSAYPEGVRENGMYCHGVQWLVGAARILAEHLEQRGELEAADHYREATYRLWLKISPIPHVTAEQIETYGGQPNKQAADLLTVGEAGRMIWSGYTGAAGWMLRQALESVIGARLLAGEVVLPADIDEPRGALRVLSVRRHRPEET